MPPVVKKGSLLPYLQNEVFDFDPSRGYIYRADYKGADQDLMLALQQDYARSGIACRLVFHQGDTASLEVEDSTQQFTIDTWQLVGNEERPDLLLHPTVQAAGDAVINAIANQLNHGQKPDDAFSGDSVLNALGADTKTLLKRYYQMHFQGDEEFIRDQYVLRHTTNAPNRWTSNIADFGVGNIYSPAQLLTEAQNRSLWILPLPGRLAYKIGAIPAPATKANYMWGWLKRGSTETTAANNRVDITQEYVLYQWSTDKYVPF